MAPQGDERMGDLFRREAAASGYASAWEQFAAGRLSTTSEVVERLAAEPIPVGEPAARALGERYGVGGWLIWSVVSRNR
jgi:hypothetical protein